ncbi:hypothetical protein [Sphingomonas sp.]|uniref:hypothetical protein n=1 Tax=Sphingomonas sp. TaxID=28214 RepID=UPI0035AFB990
MLTMVMLCLWGLLIVAPDSAIGQALRRGLVEAPARALLRVQRAHMVLGIIVGIVLLAGWMLEADEIRMVLMAAPDVMGLVPLIEMGTLTDLVAALAGASVMARMRGVGSWLRARLGRGQRRRRSVRTRLDDEPGPIWGMAWG